MTSVRNEPLVTGLPISSCIAFLDPGVRLGLAKEMVVNLAVLMLPDLT